MTNNFPLVISIGVLIVIIAFSWYLGYRRKMRLEKLVKDFDKYALSRHIAIDKKQTLNNNMIGIDKQNQKLLFLNRSRQPEEFSLINLKDLKSCEIYKDKENNKGHIKNISLRCQFRNNEPDVLLPFYEAGVDRPIKTMRLAKKANYWMKSINIFRVHA